jgi:hypothetical protein
MGAYIGDLAERVEKMRVCASRNVGSLSPRAGLRGWSES